jgi:hypothetical protein
MNDRRRFWLPLLALTGLLSLLFFKGANHPALQIIRMFSWPLTALAVGSLVWSVIPGKWLPASSRMERALPLGRGDWRPALAVFICALALFSFTRSFLISSKPDDFRVHHLLTGDEPSYLLITHSLVLDGDLDLSNNIDDFIYFGRSPLLGKDQFGFNFYNRIAQGRLTGQENKWGDRQYFINRPGLPVLLAPAYWIGFQAEKRIRFAVLVWMNVLAAFFILTLYFLARTYSGPTVSVSLALVFALTPPVVYYSSQIYPELPAALCLAGALLGLIQAEKRRGILLTGLAVACLPWFHERFIGMFFVLLVTAFFRPEFRGRWLFFLLLPSLSLVLQGMYYYSFYGLPLPLNSHKPLSIWAAPRGLLALFTDRDKGLLFLNPLLVLSLVGLFPLWRVDRRLTVVLMALLLSYLIPVASFPDWHGGICPPLRYLVALVPLTVIPVSVFFKQESWPFTRAALFVLGAWGVWNGLSLAVQPKLWFWEYGPIFQPQAYQAAHAFFPGYFHPEAQSKFLSLSWIALLVIFPGLDLIGRVNDKADIRPPILPWVSFIMTAGILMISIGSWLIRK